MWSLPKWQKFIFSLKCLSAWESNKDLITEKGKGRRKNLQAYSKNLRIIWKSKDTILELYLILHLNLWHYFFLDESTYVLLSISLMIWSIAILLYMEQYRDKNKDQKIV